ncbi:hypothetical protein BGZ76_010072 [Entomortierella beljakovae]|nr:hypothetical protein BGZ76_010072 [Entomortierella beljakovae]
MARLGPKKEHARGWTANTFMPDHDSPSTLDAISENAMDEDLLQVEDAAQALLESTADNMTTLSSNNDMEDDEVDQNENDSENEEGTDEDDDDQSHTEEDEEDDDGESSQDQGTSEDSEDDVEGTVEQNDDNSERINMPKRSRTGTASKKKKTSLSTSPSNSSKVVSATPTKKITKKSKKTIKSKGSKGTLNGGGRQVNEEAKLEAAKPIVSRFLELENTKLNDKLMQLFMINGMIPYVIESITRLDPEVAKELENELDEGVNQESKFVIHDKHCRRKRDYSDINLMKKSYIAMNFFLRGDVYNEFILGIIHQTIVRELFKIFRPESNGNFYHFQKLFEAILKKYRAQTMATLFMESESGNGGPKSALIFDMLPYLDQNPVSLCMSKLLFPTYTYGIAEKIQDYYRILKEGHFMEMLLAMVTLRDEPSPNMADFVVSLLDEVTRAKDAKVIFTCLADDPIWAERLMQGVKSTSPVQRHSCIEIIYSILVRSIQVPFQDVFANSIYISERSHEKVESHMERIATEFGKHLAPYIPDLCHSFIGSKSSGGQVTLPGYTIPRSFTVARLWLLDSIYHCLNDVEHNPALLKLIPEEFWTMLVDSFIQFRFNNAFHVHFYKLFRVVLYSEQAEIYDRFIVKPNLVGRLIEHYLAAGRPTGSKGYIILILNCIRLSFDLEKKNNEDESKDETNSEDKEGKINSIFWATLLHSTTEWEGFQPTLREATLEQTRDTSCQMDPNLRFQFAPLQSKHPHEAPLTKRHTGIPGVSARGIDGIDLGSKCKLLNYAPIVTDGNSLGFGVPMKYDREADEQSKKATVKDHELQVQKALANLMPNVDWRLIPPQRMLGLNKGISPADAKQGSAAGSADLTLASKEGSKESTSNSNSSNDTAPSTTSKTKKKKKNKKKRQISSVNTDDTTDDDENMGGKSTKGNASSDDHSEMSDSTDDGSDIEKTRESSEGNEEDSDSTSALDETEEERLERKREKKREKKRKNKMNKKNKANQQLENNP